MFAAFPDGKVVLRTLDAGSDKPLAFATPPEEPNRTRDGGLLRWLRRWWTESVGVLRSPEFRALGKRVMNGLTPFDGFESIEVQAEEASIFLRRFGTGPPVLLLHGFPQTHLMWRSVAPLLARRFTVICPDLRGYGRSGCPASRPDHAPYAKRAMAKDMVSVMEKLGFERFSIAGHDRGGRVAYRLALDHPERVAHLAVLDILTTADMWERADKR